MERRMLAQMTDWRNALCWGWWKSTGLLIRTWWETEDAGPNLHLACPSFLLCLYSHIWLSSSDISFMLTFGRDSGLKTSIPPPATLHFSLLYFSPAKPWVFWCHSPKKLNINLQYEALCVRFSVTYKLVKHSIWIRSTIFLSFFHHSQSFLFPNLCRLC